MALLIPVALWLTVCFIAPALTLNLTPTAVLNPISAMVPPPDAAFFRATNWLLSPLSITQAYTTTAAGLLDFRPATFTDPGLIPALPALILWLLGALILALRALTALPSTIGDYDA